MKYCWVTSALNVVVMMGGTVNATAVVVTVKVVTVDGMDVVIVLLTEVTMLAVKFVGRYNVVMSVVVVVVVVVVVEVEVEVEIVVVVVVVLVVEAIVVVVIVVVVVVALVIVGVVVVVVVVVVVFVS